jgi:hypothetical protein
MWAREFIVEELVKHFGEKFREEIEKTLDLERGRYSDWGNAASVMVNGIEYNVIENEEEAERIAVEVVKQDLEEEPSLFVPDFLSEYVYMTDTDKRMTALDLGEWKREEIEEEVSEGIEEIIKERLEEEIEKKEIEERRELSESEIEEIEGKIREELEEEMERRIEERVDEYIAEVEEKLEDPVDFFVEELGWYTLEELLEQPFIQIDVDKAAEDAVAIDGWEHFLNIYGEPAEYTEGGLVIFRE